MQKLSFSEMEEVQGGDFPFNPAFWCGIYAGVLAQAQATADVALGKMALGWIDEADCQSFGF